MAERDTLDIDLRLRAMRQRAQRPPLPGNLRQLGGVGRFVPAPRAGSQQPVVAGIITQARRTDQHLHYLQHEKGRDGADAPLFGTTSPAQFAKDAANDSHQFRFAVSFERQPRLFDQQAYITLLMRQVERDLGRPLAWLAATHYDTAHPHTHVALRGKDRNGEDLYITKDYLSHGIRYRAAQLATALLGMERSQEQRREPDRTTRRMPGQAQEPNEIVPENVSGSIYAAQEVIRYDPSGRIAQVWRDGQPVRTPDHFDLNTLGFGPDMRSNEVNRLAQAQRRGLNRKVEQQRGQDMGV